MERSRGPARLGEMLIASARGGDGALKASLGETVYLSVVSRGNLKWRRGPTSWCAAAARLQNARVTVSDLSSPEASLATSCVAVCSVISSSSSENQPDVVGQAVTSSCDCGGRRFAGTRHSCGIEALRSALFLAPMCSQMGAGLSVAARPFALEAKTYACFVSAVIPMVCKLRAKD